MKCLQVSYISAIILLCMCSLTSCSGVYKMDWSRSACSWYLESQICLPGSFIPHFDFSFSFLYSMLEWFVARMWFCGDQTKWQLKYWTLKTQTSQTVFINFYLCLMFSLVFASFSLHGHFLVWRLCGIQWKRILCHPGLKCFFEAKYSLFRYHLIQCQITTRKGFPPWMLFKPLQNT